ncbi:hypothetical protein [Sutterella megalosphaeroides]|uniref:Uncharacterized protein n=1 Tax=Sutterella megalosphaeroides TaxID=2494234 RepID=A0A2Z6I9U8_9BURK|nr:hypothetical protein [Sutterella megalosphaeroides]BBF23132.1 hypothetical protein SUTMEG_10230 [Sutterella megalosphaeroides]
MTATTATQPTRPQDARANARRGESGGILLYAAFAVILLSSLAFLMTTLTPNTLSGVMDLKKYIESLNTEVGEVPEETPPPQIVVDYGSVIDAGFQQAAAAAGMDPKDYILAFWQWSDPWYILDSDGKKHYFLIDNPKDVSGGVIHDWPNEKFIVNLTVKPMDGLNRTLKFTLVYPWPH